MNAFSHHQNLKQLHSIIDNYQKKLDDQVDNMFAHILNQANNTNEILLPPIKNRESFQGKGSKIMEASRQRRTFSTRSRSFVINGDVSFQSEVPEVESLIKTFKNMGEAEKLRSVKSVMAPAGVRAIGKQSYVKPKIVRKKPEILSKQQRNDPFFEKNAIKAQQLKLGMLTLIERGKVGKNIDIITAFQKGRPILEAHPAIVHHLQQKFTDTDFQIQPKQPIEKLSKKPTLPTNIPSRNIKAPNNLINSDDIDAQYNTSRQNGWALTMPQNSYCHEFKQAIQQKNYLDSNLELPYIKFIHYKASRTDQNFILMKRMPAFNKQWGEVQQIIHAIEKQLEKRNIQFVYCKSKQILRLAENKQCLQKLSLKDIEECLVKMNESSKKSIFSLKSLPNEQSKKNFASKLISSVFKLILTRSRYNGIIKRKHYQNKVRQWVLNGLIIKDYRKSLQKHRQKTMKQFELLQQKFRKNLHKIQQSKHFEIHIANKKFMKDFNNYRQFCNTEITRIFNLENNNTNIIYVSPYNVSSEAINYYFKIMELEEVNNYNQRVTFLQLEDVTSKVNLIESLNASQKLYYSTKALKRLKKKIEGVPAYFVTNHPSQTDINLAVFLGVPIYCGDFKKINPMRSALAQQRLLCAGINPTPSFIIEPKQFNVFELFSILSQYCQSNKKQRKYVIKINNMNSSSGLALLSYPFNSLIQMYSNTALVQSHYFKSIEKYFVELVRCGGVVQKYEEGVRLISVSAKIHSDNSHELLGTFEKISSGFVNIGYIFPQKAITHSVMQEKCLPILDKLASMGHIGFTEITLCVTIEGAVFLDEIELFSTKITNSLFYFKFLAGGTFNDNGQFMTKITSQNEETNEQVQTMESRVYCYIPFVLHFGLTEKQISSFFQLCRISGVSFDLENKFGTTFIILGSLKDSVGLIGTAKDRKNALRLISKSAQFLMQQNSHNISTEALQQKQMRMKERFNISSIKERIQELL